MRCSHFEGARACEVARGFLARFPLPECRGGAELISWQRSFTERNGIRISSPEESTKILRELSEAEELTVTIKGKDGPQVLSMPTPGRLRSNP